MTRSVRGAGAGRDRPGATDTTMLIWKLIEAEPGITRDQIVAKVGARIPLGYARRRYLNARASVRAAKGNIVPRSAILPSIDAATARSYLITHILGMLRSRKAVERDAMGGYQVLRSLWYEGAPEAIDHTGTKAAEHLTVAYALQKLDKWRARVNGSKHPTMNREEFAAYDIVRPHVRIQT